MLCFLIFLHVNLLKSGLVGHLKGYHWRYSLLNLLVLLFAWINVYNLRVRHPVRLPVVIVVVAVSVEAVAHVSKELQTRTHREEKLARRLSQSKPVLISSSCAKAGDDKRKEGEEERGGGGKEGDLHGLVELVGEEDEEHKERHHQEAVAQGRVGRGPSVILIDIRHPEEDPGEDDGVEDTHQRDAEHDPQGDEGDLPGPGDDVVKFESKKHELENVDSTEQFQLKRSVMSHTPHTDGNTQDTDNHQGDEHKDPLVSPGVQVIRGQELEHEEQQVNSEGDKHGLVLGVLLCV